MKNMCTIFSAEMLISREVAVHVRLRARWCMQQGQPPKGCLVYPNGWQHSSNDTVFGAFSTYYIQ